MRYYVNNQKISDKAISDGSMEHPFLTITEASEKAGPGDEVLVYPGIYHEWVNPKTGGSDKDHPITYRSIEPGKAIITGAEALSDWTHVEGSVWKASVPNEIFGDYNPYTTIIKGDWYNPHNHNHTGEIYINGKSMYETTDLNEVYSPSIFTMSWDQPWTIYKWYTCQEDDHTILYANFHEFNPNKECIEINVRRRCFFPEKEGINYITISGFVMKQAATQWAPPTAFQDGMVGPHWSKGWVIENCEIFDSKCSGISLGKFLQPENNNKWSLKGLKDGTQNERDVICLAQINGWTKENIGHHVIRNCEIHHCGQTGIVGHLGGIFSLIEGNHIHHINNKQDLEGAEIGGIKMHASIDCIYRNNRIHHCTRGLWLDWQAQGTRVTGNLFYDNTPPEGTFMASDVLRNGEDIFVEVSHGPTLIDNNYLLSKASLRLPTQGVAICHNMIAGSFTCVGKGVMNGTIKNPSPRYTPYHVPHRTEVVGFMTILHGDMRFYNNIFIQQDIREDLLKFAIEKSNGEIQYTCGTLPYEDYPTYEEYMERLLRLNPLDGEDRDRYYDYLPVTSQGNVYLNGAKAISREKDALISNQTFDFDLEYTDTGVTIHTNLYEDADSLLSIARPMVDTALLGMAFEPEQYFEDVDGSPITLDVDYHGKKREAKGILPGPSAHVLGKDIIL